jgi:succinyl-diaminopimelate desuccinylase
MSSLKERFLESAENRQTELIELCSSLVKIPSDNPPGDTTKLASFITEYLTDRGIEVDRYEPQKGIVNLVAETGDGAPHLVLNGHLDQFPGDVGEPWSVPPYSGKLSSGRIYGRGSGDMKGGLASLLFTFVLIAEEEDLPGRVSLVGTSDEETGGRWGALWLLQNVEGVRGDAVLNGEPSGLTVRIGEKGRVPFLLRAEGKAAHGSFAGYVGENAIMKMVRVLPTVEELKEIKASFTPETEELTLEVMKGYERQYGHESKDMAEVMRHVTVNIGVIRGGTKDNIVPAQCEAEVDMRIPLGVAPDELKKKLESKIGRVDPSITVEWGRHPSTIIESTYTSPESKIAAYLWENSKEMTGVDPLFSFTSGGTDCRFWRKLGVPAVSYGPRVYGMGGVDEHITVDDLMITVKAHVGTVIDYLTSARTREE